MAFFSVLIPVYNQVGKMQNCVDSLNAQKFQDFEVILVDDGSTDASYQMLCDFAAADSRMKVVQHEKNGSLVAARYTGMRHATGKYIILLDSDDYLAPDTMEILHAKLIVNEPDLLRFGYVKEPSGESVSPKPEENTDPLALLYKGTLTPSIWKNVYKNTVISQVVEKTQPFYCNMGEDVYFSTIFYTFAKTVECIDDVLYHYQEETGMSSMNMDLDKSMAKLRRSLTDTKACGDHITAFLEQFAPERLSAAKEAIDRMKLFVFIQHSLRETDYRKILEYAFEYKNMGEEELYDRICNSVLIKKVLYDNGYYVYQGPEEKQQ